MKTVPNPTRALVEGLLARCTTVSALVAGLVLVRKKEDLDNPETSEKLARAEAETNDIYNDLSTLPGLTPPIRKSTGDKPADDANLRIKMDYYRSRARAIGEDIAAAQNALTAYLAQLPETVEVEEEQASEEQAPAEEPGNPPQPPEEPTPEGPRREERRPETPPEENIRPVPPPPRNEHDDGRAPEGPRREERRTAETPPPPAAAPPKREHGPFSWGTLLLMVAALILFAVGSVWLFSKMSQTDVPATAQADLPTSPVETPASTTPPTPAVSTPTPPTATANEAVLDCAKAQVVMDNGGSYAVIPVHGGKSTVWVSEWAVAAGNTCVRPNGSIVTEAAFTKLRREFKDAIGNDAPLAGLTPPTLVGERLVRCQIGVGKLADCFE